MFMSTLNSSYLIKEHPSMWEASGLFHEIISNFSTFWFSNLSLFLWQLSLIDPYVHNICLFKSTLAFIKLQNGLPWTGQTMPESQAFNVFCFVLFCFF